MPALTSDTPATGGFRSCGRNATSAQFTEEETRKLRAAYIRRLAKALIFGDLVAFDTASREEQEEAKAISGTVAGDHAVTVE
jgi:hypothetical protein